MLKERYNFKEKNEMSEEKPKEPQITKFSSHLPENLQTLRKIQNLIGKMYKYITKIIKNTGVY